MGSFDILGTILNLAASIVLLLPFFFVYRNGRLHLRTRKAIQDETATLFNGNPYLADSLLFSQRCALLALPLLILGTTLLLL